MFESRRCVSVLLLLLLGVYIASAREDRINILFIFDIITEIT